MNILIFGGGGFLGSAICDRLLRGGHSIRIFERPRVQPYRHFAKSEALEWVSGDFSSRHDIKESLAGMNAVVHLVSTTLPKNSNDDTIYDVQSNVVATLQLLEEIREKGIRKVIFISSGGTVYGMPEVFPVAESHPTEPICSYGITKLAIEKYLKLYMRLHGIQPVILRLANPYGPRQRVETAQGAVAAFLSRALNGKPIRIWGDGSVVRDYIFVEDVADAFAAALDYDGEETVFNIGSGTGTSLNHLVEKIETLMGVPLQMEYLPSRNFDVPKNFLCIQKAKNLLGWRPRADMEMGLAKTMAWLKAI
jgi:UDP-glucose 4-epimerase